MSEKIELTLCMGSACHQSGVYDVLPRLQKLLLQNHLNEDVELKGAFCLGPCSDGVVVKFLDKIFLNITPDNADIKFQEEILPAIQNHLSTEGLSDEHE